MLLCLLDVEQFVETCHPQDVHDIRLHIEQFQCSPFGHTLFLQFEQASQSKTADIFQIGAVELDGFCCLSFQLLECLKEVECVLCVYPARRFVCIDTVFFFDFEIHFTVTMLKDK